MVEKNLWKKILSLTVIKYEKNKQKNLGKSNNNLGFFIQFGISEPYQQQTIFSTKIYYSIFVNEDLVKKKTDELLKISNTV